VNKEKFKGKMLFKSLMFSSLLALVASEQTIRKWNYPRSLGGCAMGEKLDGSQ
jgi:hypothetical protein